MSTFRGPKKRRPERCFWITSPMGLSAAAAGLSSVIGMAFGSGYRVTRSFATPSQNVRNFPDVIRTLDQSHRRQWRPVVKMGSAPPHISETHLRPLATINARNSTDTIYYIRRDRRLRPDHHVYVSRPKKKKARTLLSQHSGHKPGNNLLSRDLTSYYHWLLGA